MGAIMSTNSEGAPSSAYRTYVLAALSTVGLMNNVDRVVIYMFLQPIKKEFLLSDTEVGLLSGAAFAIMAGIVAIPLARLADRGNRKWLIAGCFAAWSFFTAICGAASNFAMLMLARVGVGIGEAGSPPATASMLGDYYPRDLRSRAFAVFTATTAIGGVSGWVGGGLLVQAVGWRNGFFILGAIGLVLALIFHWTVREPTRVDVKPPADLPAKGVLAELGDLRSFAMLTAAMALAGFVGAASSWLPSYFARTFNLPPIQVGLGLGLSLGFPFAIGTIVGGQLGVRHVRNSKSWAARFAAVSMAMGTPFLVGCFLAPTPMLAFGSLFVSMLLIGASTGPINVTVQDLVSPHARATAIAITSIALLVFGGGLGPVLIGAISDWLLLRDPAANSLRLALMSTAIPLLAASVMYWLLGRRIDAKQLELA
ncbi:MAG: MFS transporter [Betaproteobacteria bacterium]|nr:MFS transporter [Betaproteobacteria bacterium]